MLESLMINKQRSILLKQSIVALKHVFAKACQREGYDFKANEIVELDSKEVTLTNVFKAINNFIYTFVDVLAQLSENNKLTVIKNLMKQTAQLACWMDIVESFTLQINEPVNSSLYEVMAFTNDLINQYFDKPSKNESILVYQAVKELGIDLTGGGLINNFIKKAFETAALPAFAELQVYTLYYISRCHSGFYDKQNLLVKSLDNLEESQNHLANALYHYAQMIINYQSDEKIEDTLANVNQMKASIDQIAQLKTSIDSLWQTINTDAQLPYELKVQLHGLAFELKSKVNKELIKKFPPKYQNALKNIYDEENKNIEAFIASISKSQQRQSELNVKYDGVQQDLIKISNLAQQFLTEKLMRLKFDIQPAPNIPSQPLLKDRYRAVQKLAQSYEQDLLKLANVKNEYKKLRETWFQYINTYPNLKEFINKNLAILDSELQGLEVHQSSIKEYQKILGTEAYTTIINDYEKLGKKLSLYSEKEHLELQLKDYEKEKIEIINALENLKTQREQAMQEKISLEAENRRINNALRKVLNERDIKKSQISEKRKMLLMVSQLNIPMMAFNNNEINEIEKILGVDTTHHYFWKIIVQQKESSVLTASRQKKKARDALKKFHQSKMNQLKNEFNILKKNQTLVEEKMNRFIESQEIIAAKLSDLCLSIDNSDSIDKETISKLELDLRNIHSDKIGPAQLNINKIETQISEISRQELIQAELERCQKNKTKQFIYELANQVGVIEKLRNKASLLNAEISQWKKQSLLASIVMNLHAGDKQKILKEVKVFENFMRDFDKRVNSEGCMGSVQSDEIYKNTIETIKRTREILDKSEQRVQEEKESEDITFEKVDNAASNFINSVNKYFSSRSLFYKAIDHFDTIIKIGAKFLFVSYQSRYEREKKYTEVLKNKAQVILNRRDHSSYLAFKNMLNKPIGSHSYFFDYHKGLNEIIEDTKQAIDSSNSLPILKIIPNRYLVAAG